MPLDGEIKKIIEDLGTTHEAFKKSVEEELAQIKKAGQPDPLTTQKIQKLNDRLDQLTDAKSKADKHLEDLEKKLARQSFSGGEGDDKFAAELKAMNHTIAATRNGRAEQFDADGYRAYKTVLNQFLRNGNEHFSDSERKTLAVGADPDGGYLVTPDRTGAIVTRVFETSPMRQICTVQTIGTDALEGLRDTDQASAGWVGETAARPVTGTPALGQWRIPTREMFAQPDATQKMLDDSSIDVEAWLAEKVADRFARLENTAFITGDGVTQPRGITTYPTAATADDTRAWGTFEHIATGVSSNFPATAPADRLFDLVQAVKSEYLTNARFLTRRSVMQLVRKFKDTTNQYLWQPSLQAGVPETLLGYPVFYAEDMPALAANSLSMAFGDFARCYTIVDRIGVRTIRDNVTNKPFVRFYSIKRVGGDVVQFECVKFMRFG
jgi:HK97 family phage major capsid protein